MAASDYLSQRYHGSAFHCRLYIFTFTFIYAGAHAWREIVSRLQILIAPQSIPSGLSNVEEVEGIWINLGCNQKGSVARPSVGNCFSSLLLWENIINRVFRSH